MPQPCRVCNHPDREAIDRALVVETGIRLVAAEFHLNWQAVRRHRENHLFPAARTALSADATLRDVDPIAELRALYARMLTHLANAERADNWPAVRAFHSEARQDLELLSKLLGRLRDGTTVNVATVVSTELPHIIAVVRSALAPFPAARDAVALALRAQGAADQ